MESRTKFGELSRMEIEVLKGELTDAAAHNKHLLVNALKHVIALAEANVDYTLSDDAIKAIKESVGRSIKQGLFDKWLKESVLPEIFGKHNLTASEEKPRETYIDGKFHIWDRVITTAYCPLYGKGWVGTVVRCHESDVDVAFGLRVVPHVALCDLAPCTEEQEPKNGERVDFPSSSLQNCKELTENDSSSMSKEDAEELAKCLAAIDDSIKESKMQQVDWLAYRMELVKLMLPKVISSCDIDYMTEDTFGWEHDEAIGYHVVKIANKIVKELNLTKNGEKNGDC